MEERTSWTPLHRACADLDVESVRNLAKDADDSSAMIEAKTAENGQTALHLTAWTAEFDDRQLEIARILLDAGANIEATTGRVVIRRVDRFDLTPFHHAVYRNDCNMTELLLDRGANAEAKTRNGATPLEFAVGGRCSDRMPLVELLINRGGADLLNSRSTKGFTPLHLVVFRHDAVPWIEFLLEQGADANAKTYNDTNNGCAALHLATAIPNPENAVEVARLLLILKQKLTRTHRQLCIWRATVDVWICSAFWWSEVPTCMQSKQVLDTLHCMRHASTAVTPR